MWACVPQLEVKGWVIAPLSSSSPHPAPVASAPTQTTRGILAHGAMTLTGYSFPSCSSCSPASLTTTGFQSTEWAQIQHRMQPYCPSPIARLSEFVVFITTCCLLFLVSRSAVPSCLGEVVCCVCVCVSLFCGLHCCASLANVDIQSGECVVFLQSQSGANTVVYLNGWRWWWWYRCRAGRGRRDPRLSRVAGS